MMIGDYITDDGIDVINNYESYCDETPNNKLTSTQTFKNMNNLEFFRLLLKADVWNINLDAPLPMLRGRKCTFTCKNFYYGCSCEESGTNGYYENLGRYSDSLISSSKYFKENSYPYHEYEYRSSTYMFTNPILSEFTECEKEMQKHYCRYTKLKLMKVKTIKDTEYIFKFKTFR